MSPPAPETVRRRVRTTRSVPVPTAMPTAQAERPAGIPHPHSPSMGESSGSQSRLPLKRASKRHTFIAGKNIRSYECKIVKAGVFPAQRLQTQLLSTLFRVRSPPLTIEFHAPSQEWRFLGRLLASLSPSTILPTRLVTL